MAATNNSGVINNNNSSNVNITSSNSHNTSIGGGGSANGMVLMQKSVAIVTPQRSSSMDYLNFEERRQLIASSLSLSEILSNGGGQGKEPVSVANTGLGKLRGE